MLTEANNNREKRELGSKISVCVLTYNHATVIESTLRSVLDQSLSGYEVVVSDDCSTDDTWARIQDLARREPALRPVRTPRNLGMAGNANFAVSLANGPYVALLHHDDLYRQDLLEKWAAVLEEHSTVGFVFNPYKRHTDDFVYREEIPAGLVDGRWFLESVLLPRWGCAVRGTAMIRRSAWDQVGGMREKYGLLADIDLWMRLAMRWDVGYVAEPLIAVRHQRPNDYPEDYGETWSWRRHRYLYEIHAANRLAYFNRRTARDSLEWARFRARLNLETFKWLVYGVVKRKPHVLSTCMDGVTDYDAAPLRLLRSVLWNTQRIVTDREQNRPACSPPA